MVNCVDIVRPFNEAIADRDDIQLIGGIGSAALTDLKTVIVPDEKRVIAPADLYLPQRRDDGNLRDFDAIVMSTDAQRVADVRALGQELIGRELELSFFDLKPIERLEDWRRHPLRAAGQFVSDRYVAQSADGRITEAQKALFPFAVDAPLETLETWRLYIGEKDKYPAPIPHPGTVVLNYLTRSVSGLRPKDAQKIRTLSGQIAVKAPEIRDWVMEGPGRSQIELAQILNQLGSGEKLVMPLAVIQPCPGELRNHPAFMLADAPAATQAAVLAVSYAKARSMHAFESNPRVVTFWQKHVEGLVGKVVHNE